MGRALFGYTVVNLGCKVNRVEADGFERLLAERGGVPVGEAAADLIVVAGKNVGLRGGVRAHLAGLADRDVFHERIHVVEVRAVVCARVLRKPCHALLRHVFARVAHVAHQ